jgi:hypothetical protein
MFPIEPDPPHERHKSYPGYVYNLYDYAYDL